MPAPVSPSVGLGVVHLFCKVGSGVDRAAVTAAVATEIDIAKRTGLINEAWDLIKADMPYVPIHHQVLAWGLASTVDIPIAADDAFRPRFAVMK